MEAKNLSSQDQRALITLSNLPQRILSLHGRDNMAEFVMHDLCGPNCFNIKRAAYLVDNGDFNCCKGVVGYADDARFDKDVWHHPEPFSEFMKRSSFNNKVREISMQCSLQEGDDKHLHQVAQQLGLKNPSYYRWDLKHGNKGIFIFEQQDGVAPYFQGLCLLGFCPIH